MSIYDSAPFEPVKPDQILPNKPDSYGVYYKGKKLAIRNTPRVNEHVARMIIRYNMDAEAAVSKMLPEDVDMPEAQIRMYAQSLLQRPQVGRYLQEILAQLGLTNESLKIVLAIIWQVAFDTKSKHWPAAVKLLADLGGWVKKTDESDKPVTLVLKGFEKDLEELFDGKVPEANAMPARRAILKESSDEETDSVQ